MNWIQCQKCDSWFHNACQGLPELEIWGKAQRESARRPKSEWGKLGGKEERGRISPASKSRGPNSNALAYAERALST